MPLGEGILLTSEEREDKSSHTSISSGSCEFCVAPGGYARSYQTQHTNTVGQLVACDACEEPLTNH